MGSDRDGNNIELSKRNVKAIMHQHNDRISDDAAIHMAYEVEQMVNRKTRAASLVAQSKGRKTIKEEDVRVVNEIMGVMKGDD